MHMFTLNIDLIDKVKHVLNPFVYHNFDMFWTIFPVSKCTFLIFEDSTMKNVRRFVKRLQ